MRKFASFVMAGRWQAISAAVLLAALGMMLPPFTLLSGAVVALVTLRLGAVQGLVVVGWALVALILLSFGVLGQFQVGLVYGLAQWAPVLVFALLLRRSASWALIMQVMGVVGVAAVLLVHALIPDVGQVWQNVLQTSLADTLHHLGMSADQTKSAISHAARYFTGIFVISLVLSISISLVLARAWQAMLFNPGGFREEFTRWRMNPAFAGAATLLVGAALLMQNALLVELAVVVLAPFLMQAIGLMHGLVRQTGLNVGWLVGLYALLVLATLQMAALLSAVGVVDCFVDIRGRLARRS